MRGRRRNRAREFWSGHKFNVDGVGRGKPVPVRVGIGGVLHNDGGGIFIFQSGFKEFKEADLFFIRRDLKLWDRHIYGNLVIEGDSINAIIWASGKKKPPSRLVHSFKDIKKACKGKVVLF